MICYETRNDRKFGVNPCYQVFIYIYVKIIIILPLESWYAPKNKFKWTYKIDSKFWLFAWYGPCGIFVNLNRTGFIFIQVNQTKLLNKPLKFVVMNLADISLIWLFLFPQKSENWKNIMEDLMPHLAKIKAPFGQEKVYKEECTFSFDNPVSIENSRDGI